MSTQQPPGGPAEGGYAQPQDPWGGYEPGVASVPTDPIPQQYPPMGPGDVWSQSTVAQGGPYGYVPQQPQPAGKGKLIGISLLALLLAGGAGYGAYWYLNKNTGPTGVSATTTPTPTTTAPPTEVAFDPHAAKVGDCVFNQGTPEKPKLAYVECSTAKSYKIVKIVTGPDLPEGPKGDFDTSTAVYACKDLSYQTWYGYQDAVTETRDVFYCMSNNP